MTKIAVIDMDSVAYVIGNGKKTYDSNGVPIRENGKLVYIDKTEAELQQSADVTMKDILSACRATHYIGFIKGNNTTDFRKIVYSGYKANRSDEPPHWWEFVKQDLIRRWGIIQADNREVDDYVNVTRLHLPNSFICAVDKDLLSLEGRHFNWSKREWVTVSAQDAERAFWRDMVAGQPVDNVKGIPGRGPKFYEGLVVEAVKKDLSLRTMVFEQYVIDFGETEGIYEFYKNYTALKIVEDIPLFTLPRPVPFEKNIKQTVDPKSFFAE